MEKQMKIPDIEKIYYVDTQDARGKYPRSKAVHVFTREGKIRVSFGFPVEYDLCGKYGLLNSHPFKQSICVDISGRTNGGFPLYVVASALNLLIEEILQDYPVVWTIHQSYVRKPNDLQL